ncbi:MAG TPA: glycosyltransferase family 2 protein [Burkholderiales bacterium]|nr:glycosyltransferase family 2 protein [Burkholderiales bacterium]
MHASPLPESPPARPGPAAGPLVSVGLPVYNGETFLRGAIDSVLGQSHANLELIVSDNASTDGSGAIAAEYALRDPRVRHVRQPRNIGATRNYNFVAAAARGKYMKWASANDYCDAAMLAACVEVLESDSRAVLCYGRTRLVEETTGAVRPFEGDLSLTEDSPSVRLFRVLTEMTLNNAFNGLIRADALRRTGLIRNYPAGDIVLMAELAMAGTFVLLPQPLLHRRMGPRTFSSQLSDAELRYFLDPEAKSGAGLDRLRMNLDYFRSALRAPMSFREKRRALALLARSAYWDMRRTFGRPRRESDVRP